MSAEKRRNETQESVASTNSINPKENAEEREIPWYGYPVPTVRTMAALGHPTAEFARGARNDFRDTRAKPACVVLALALSTLLQFGCQGPCESLADRICGCEPNRLERDACQQQIRSAGNPDITPQENEVCETLLDTCTCDALEREDIQACGLSKT